MSDLSAIHPYRDPVGIEKLLADEPTTETLRAVDDICVDLIEGVASGDLDAEPRAGLARTVGLLLRFRRSMIDEMAKRRIRYGTLLVVAPALIPVALKWLPAIAAGIVALALIALAGWAALAIGAVLRAEAVGARIGEARAELSRYLAARPADGLTKTGVRVQIEARSEDPPDEARFEALNRKKETL